LAERRLETKSHEKFIISISDFSSYDELPRFTILGTEMFMADFIANEWLTIAFGLLAIFMTVWGVKQSQRKTLVSYVLITGSVLGPHSRNLPDNVTIAYDDHPVTDVARTSIAVWNSGNTTIVNDQIVEDHPPHIHFTGKGSILNAKVTHSSRDSSKVRLGASSASPEGTALWFSFDYLEPNEGAVFEVLHTPFKNVYLECPLRGMKTSPERITESRPGLPIERTGPVPVPFLSSSTKAHIARSMLSMVSAVFIFAGIYLIAPDIAQSAVTNFFNTSEIQLGGASDLVWSIGEVMVGFMTLLIGVAFFAGVMTISKKAPADLDKYLH